MHRKKCTKHQHWVPQFYLRYFATPESRNTEHPQVWIFPKGPKDEGIKPTTIRNVCGKRYLYSPQQLDGGRSWVLEDKLNDVETLLGPIWSDLATNFVALEEGHIRKALALFISITHMRHRRETSRQTNRFLRDWPRASRRHSNDRIGRLQK